MKNAPSPAEHDYLPSAYIRVYERSEGKDCLISCLMQCLGQRWIQNTGWKFGTVNTAWKILDGKHHQLDQRSVSPGWTDNFKLKPDHWIL